MAESGNVYSFDFDIARQAAERWQSETRSRNIKLKAVERGDFEKADTPARLALRVNRLASTMRGIPDRYLKSLPADVENLVEGASVTAASVTSGVYERVINATRDFLPTLFLSRGAKAASAVCRLTTRLPDGRTAFGTGFLVTPELLITNWHVLKTAQAAAASVAQFDYELSDDNAVGQPTEFKLDPQKFFLSYEKLDVALVAISQKSKSDRDLKTYGYLRLIAAEGKIIVGERVNIIQHPLGEPKQVVLQENKLLDLPDKLDHFAYYEADTEPGSSGSPVLNDQWEVIALHHSGVPKMNSQGQVLDKDGAVVGPRDDPARILWIANEGIRISRLIAYIAAADIGDSDAKMRKTLLDISGFKGSSNRRQPPPEDFAGTDVAADDRDDAMTSAPIRRPAIIERRSGSFSVTVPLTITLSFGEPAGAPGASAHSFSHADVLTESSRPEPDYEARPGYDPNFLGVKIPLPTLERSIKDDATVIESGGTELRYFHYSVIMSSSRKLAYVSAVNIDAEAPENFARKGSDRWFFDPRIGEADQTGGRLYQGNPLDRGHLTRRADAAWGYTLAEAEQANNDTFHWTNCAPQHEVFNQSTLADGRGLKLWGNIENHIASEAAREGKLTVFNGPVFRSGDRTYRGVQLPKEFWKVVVCEADGGGLKAVAFKLSQDSLIRDLPSEDFEEGPYKPFQIKVSALEVLTNLRFGNLRRFDPLNEDANENLLEAETSARAIDKLSQIVV